MLVACWVLVMYTGVHGEYNPVCTGVQFWHTDNTFNTKTLQKHHQVVETSGDEGNICSMESSEMPESKTGEK